jgi:hypothetical protein
MKAKIFGITSSLEMRPGSTIMTQTANARVCSGSTQLPPSLKKFKTQPSAGKVKLAVFWDSQGPVLEHYQERGNTVTSGRYCDMLRNELKPTIHKKLRGNLSQGVLLLDDNAHPHSAAHTKETLQELKYEALDHPLYSKTLQLLTFICLDP